jgi:hypothetical protein
LRASELMRGSCSHCEISRYVLMTYVPSSCSETGVRRSCANKRYGFARFRTSVACWKSVVVVVVTIGWLQAFDRVDRSEASRRPVIVLGGRNRTRTPTAPREFRAHSS